MGSVTVFRGSHTIPNEDSIRACYLETHPDAKRWLPDDEGAAHTVRMIPPIVSYSE